MLRAARFVQLQIEIDGGREQEGGKGTEGRLGGEVARDREDGWGRREKRKLRREGTKGKGKGKGEQSDRGHTTRRSHKCISLTFTLTFT